MRWQAMMAAAVLAAIPAAARADGEPVAFYGEPNLVGGNSLEVQVWIAYGYGKQIVDDNDWNEHFGTNYENAVKKDGNVVVRLQAGTCIGEVALVPGDAGARPPAPYLWNGVDFDRMQGDAGWLWTVRFPFANCGCPMVERVKLHCQGQGVIKETCHAPQADPDCVADNVVTVQAYNRPENEKCTTDLGGDEDYECDLAEIEVGLSSITRRVYEFTPMPGNGSAPAAAALKAQRGDEEGTRWTFENSPEPCTDTEYAAGCTAICYGPQWDTGSHSGDYTQIEIYPTSIVPGSHGDFDGDCSPSTTPVQPKLRRLAPARGKVPASLLIPQPKRVVAPAPGKPLQRPGLR